MRGKLAKQLRKVALTSTTELSEVSGHFEVDETLPNVYRRPTTEVGSDTRRRYRKLKRRHR